MAYKKVKLKHLHSDGFNLAALDYFYVTRKALMTVISSWLLGFIFMVEFWIVTQENIGHNQPRPTSQHRKPDRIKW